MYIFVLITIIYQNMRNKMYLDNKLFKHWWISLLVGVLSIITGVCCFIIPAGSLAVLSTFLVITLIIGGIFNIISAVRNKEWNYYWGWDLARGIMEIMLGIWAFMLPQPFLATTLVYVFGFWMLFHSIIGICESCELSMLPLKGWGWLLAFNIISLLCSFIFLSAPFYGGIFILAFIGISLILYGIFRIVLALKMKKFNKITEECEYVEVEEVE